MFIIILYNNGYCYMWARMCGSVSRETMGEGREKGRGVWSCVCETYCFRVI